METALTQISKHSKKILEALERKETVAVTYRGKRRAILISAAPPRKRPKSSEHPSFGIWKDRLSDEDVPVMVRRLRKNRFDAV
ncbi:MAG: type II toxin-antitoxin system prevent-host-death family antitoxin [Candidatus Sumerlaeota bacterium]|nr:type II toxin-antitoxin system prevent-host-death family antitoxin [Candidatus Sumerlaeota bacterium]